MATDAFYPSIEVVYIEDYGTRVPLAAESVEFYNITQGITIDTLVTDANGVIIYGGFDSTVDDADPGDVVELRHATYTLTRQFKLQATQEAAFTTGENNISTYVVQDDSTGNVTPEKVEIFIRDDAFPFQKPRKIGEAPLDGTLVKIPHQAAISQTVSIFANPVSKEAQPEFADPSIKVSTSLAVPGGFRSLFDHWDTATTTGTVYETLYDDEFPADLFNVNGDACHVLYHGTTAANGNTKAFRFVVGGTTIADLSTTANNKSWELELDLMRSDTGTLKFGVEFTVTGENPQIEVSSLAGLTFSSAIAVLFRARTITAPGDATATKAKAVFFPAAYVAPVPPFTPASETGGVRWFKASAEAYADNDAVGTVTDQFGVANGTASLTERPTFKTNIVNGKSVYRFDGTNDFVSVGDISALTSGEVFIVVKVDTDPPGAAAQTGLWKLSPPATDNTHYPFTDGSIYDGFGSTVRKTVGNPGPALTTWRIVNIHSASADWEFRLDGSALLTTGTNTVSFPSAAILGRSVVSSAPTTFYYLDGDVAEFILYDHKLASDVRTNVMTYLQDEYGL